MRLGLASAICDAIELGSLQLKLSLTPDDVLKEAMQGFDQTQARVWVEDAFGVAEDRLATCRHLYPFTVSRRVVKAKRVTGWNPYLFLLFGCASMHGGVQGAAEITRRFRKYFEDYVCWCLRRHGMLAEVLSEPRGERGLPTSLIPALRVVAKAFEEQCELLPEKITADDNDLGVDVIATSKSIDAKRSGRPVFLIQCATGTISDLSAKMAEDFNLFKSVWSWGFHERCSIRGGATPYDLQNLDRISWSRLSEQGWVLDRSRLVRMAKSGAAKQPQSNGLLELWEDFTSSLSGFDWRNSWQYALPSRD